MKDFRLAAVQCRASTDGALDRNVAMMDRHLEQAGREGAGLAVFPELSLSGYVTAPEAIHARSLTADSRVVRDAIALSARHAVYFCFGFFEQCAGRIYNTCILAGRGRKIGAYRKVHVPARETGLFEPGMEFKVWDLPFARVGASICFDNEVCESHMVLALSGAELIVMPAAWADHWEREDYVEPCASDEEVVEERRRWMTMMFGARCRDTGTYSVMANQCGPEGNGPWRFVGKSMIFAPTGRVLAEARAWGPDVIYADLDADLLHRYRQMECYTLRQRRPAAYGTLVDRHPWSTGPETMA